MGQEMVLPDWAKNKPAPVFAGLNPLDDSLSDGIGQSYPVLSYKGKVWAIRHRGERKNFIRPDDGTPASYLDVIILGQAKQKSKSYYKEFDPNLDGGRPICSSINGVVPDPDVTTKQCDTCVLCPKNQWKTNPATGKKGRDCADYKRLAVLVIPTQTKPLFGDPVLEPAFLRVPAASLNSLAIMGDTMTGQGFHYATYVTRITFDPNEAHPKMVFRPLQGLTEQEGPAVLAMRADMQVDRIIHGGFADGGMRTIPPQGGTTLLPPGHSATGLVMDLTPNPSTAAPPNPSTAATLQHAPIPVGASPASGAVQLATVVQPPQSLGLAPTDLGLGMSSGGASPAPTQQASQTLDLTANTVSDTGAPEATDDDLDNKIAGMLGKSK